MAQSLNQNPLWSMLPGLILGKSPSLFLEGIDSTAIFTLEYERIENTRLVTADYKTKRSFFLLNDKNVRTAIACQLEPFNFSCLNKTMVYVVLDETGEEILSIQGSFHKIIACLTDVEIYVNGLLAGKIRRDNIGSILLIDSDNRQIFRVYRHKKCWSVITSWDRPCPALVASIEKCVRRPIDLESDEPVIKLSDMKNKQFGIQFYTKEVRIKTVDRLILIGFALVIVSTKHSN